MPTPVGRTRCTGNPWTELRYPGKRNITTQSLTTPTQWRPNSVSSTLTSRDKAGDDAKPCHQKKAVTPPARSTRLHPALSARRAHTQAQPDNSSQAAGAKHSVTSSRAVRSYLALRPIGLSSGERILPRYTRHGKEQTLR